MFKWESYAEYTNNTTLTGEMKFDTETEAIQWFTARLNHHIHPENYTESFRMKDERFILVSEDNVELIRIHVSH